MHYILDTDICSYIIKGFSDVLLENLNRHSLDKISITSITCAELLFGANKKESEAIKNKVNLFISKVSIINFEENAAIEYAKIRYNLEKQGLPIGNMDILIASCVLSEDATLVTNNEKHFSKIHGLKIENWMSPK